MNVHAVNYQEPLLMEFVHAHTQRVIGSQAASNVFVHLTLLVTTANNAHHQEYGIGIEIPAYVQLQRQTGTPQLENASVQWADMDHIVFNAHHLDIGISQTKIVYVQVL